MKSKRAGLIMSLQKNEKKERAAHRRYNQLPIYMQQSLKLKGARGSREGQQQEAASAADVNTRSASASAGQQQQRHVKVHTRCAGVTIRRFIHSQTGRVKETSSSITTTRHPTTRRTVSHPRPAAALLSVSTSRAPPIAIPWSSSKRRTIIPSPD